MRRIAIATCVAALLIPMTSASSQPLGAEPRGITCTVTGAAKFTPGITSEPQELKFAFKGEFTDCQSSGEAASAKVTSKGIIEDASCAYGAATGIAKIKWDDGSKSVVEFTTEDVAALVTLQGIVTKSNADVPQEGDDVFAALAFNADPTLCDTEEGITEAEFGGQAGGGSPQ